ncbi:hypothetical protein ONS96_002596 [Cadophora gregata f. sp. sojae]|nr:hypothetical protein ONS96_002596 [Cadophora gregata f. sp. sojae]
MNLLLLATSLYLSFFFTLGDLPSASVGLYVSAASVGHGHGYGYVDIDRDVEVEVEIEIDIDLDLSTESSGNVHPHPNLQPHLQHQLPGGVANTPDVDVKSSGTRSGSTNPGISYPSQCPAGGYTPQTRRTFIRSPDGVEEVCVTVGFACRKSWECEDLAKERDICGEGGLKSAPEMAFCDGGVCRAMFWEWAGGSGMGEGRECGCLQGCWIGEGEEGEVGLVCGGEGRCERLGLGLGM